MTDTQDYPPPFLLRRLAALIYDTLLVLPLIYDGPAPTLFFLSTWLLGAFCLVAFFVSYAPPKPKPARPVSPLEPPGPFTTTRFPTLHDNRWKLGIRNEE